MPRSNIAFSKNTISVELSLFAARTIAVKLKFEQINDFLNRISFHTFGAIVPSITFSHDGEVYHDGEIYMFKDRSPFRNIGIRSNKLFLNNTSIRGLSCN